MGVFEILEHTADVGLRARGGSLEEVFEAATHALATILGAWRPSPSPELDVGIAVEGGDLAGQLVDWLSEVLYLQDSHDAVIAGVSVERVSEAGAAGRVLLAPRGEDVLEGTAVKAITYHQLRVEKLGEEWVADVYVDV